MVGTILNNLGSAHKSLKNWQKAEQYLRRSIEHNRVVQGDSAEVLAYSYFHMAGVCQAQGQLERAREYAQKSLVLAELHKLTDLRGEVEALLRELEGVSGK